MATKNPPNVGAGGKALAPELRYRVEQFIFDEVDLLDAWRLEEWLDLFDDDGVYWVPRSAQDRDPDLALSLMYAPKPLLRTLVQKLHMPHAHAQTPRSQFKRIVGNVRAYQEGDSLLRVTSNFVLSEVRLRYNRTLAGSYEHLLLIERGPWRIKQKRVHLLGADQAQENLSMFFL